MFFFFFLEPSSFVKNPTLGRDGPVQPCLPCSLTGREQLWRTWPPWTPRGSEGWQSALLPTAHSLRGRAKWSASMAATAPASMLVFLKLGIINFCPLQCEALKPWASEGCSDSNMPCFMVTPRVTSLKWADDHLLVFGSVWHWPCLSHTDKSRTCCVCSP